MRADFEKTLARLSVLEERMHALLSAVRSGGGSASALAQAWKTCAELAPELEQASSALVQASPAEKILMQAKLMSLRRLNAIAIERITKEQLSISELVQRTRTASDGFEYYASEAELGGSCDIAG